MKKGVGYYLLGIVIVLVGIAIFSIPYNYIIQQKVNDGLIDATQINNQAYLFALMDANWNLFYMMLPFVGGMLFLGLVVVKIHGLTWVKFTTQRKKIDYGRVVFSFGVWALFNIIIILSDYWLHPHTMLLVFEWRHFLILFLLAVILVPIQTSFEEYFFRAYLFKALQNQYWKKWGAWILTSIVFGLMHLANPEVLQLGYGIMVFYIGTGLFLGWLLVVDEGLELSLGFHMANNLVTALMVTTHWTAFQTYAVFRDISQPNLIEELTKMLFFYPLFYVIMVKKYKINNPFFKMNRID